MDGSGSLLGVTLVAAGYVGLCLVSVAMAFGVGAWVWLQLHRSDATATESAAVMHGADLELVDLPLVDLGAASVDLDGGRVGAA